MLKTAAACLNEDDFVGLRVGEWAQDHGVNHAEDSRGHAHTESEGENDGEAKPGARRNCRSA
jgi:hypothetical protein